MGGEFRAVKTLAVDDRTFYSWQEAAEREIEIAAVTLDSLASCTVKHPFQLTASTAEESLIDAQGALAGRVVRTQQAIDGCISVGAHPVNDNVFKVSVSVGKFHSSYGKPTP